MKYILAFLFISASANAAIYNERPFIAATSTSSSSTTAPGSNGQVVYNGSGLLAADSSLTYVSGGLTAFNISATNNLTASSLSASTGTITNISSTNISTSLLQGGTVSATLTSPGTNKQALYNNAGTIASTGNITISGSFTGINNATPTTSLEVIGTTSSTAVSSTNMNGLNISGTNVAGTTISGTNVYALNVSGTNATLGLLRTTGFTYVNGNTSPSTALEVNGTTSSTIISTTFLSIATSGTSSVSITDSNGKAIEISANGTKIEATASPLQLNRVSAQPVLMASGGGNVGIGLTANTTPANKLTVSSGNVSIGLGNATASSTLHVSGTLQTNGNVTFSGLATGTPTSYACIGAGGSIISNSAVCVVSSREVKENIAPLSYGLEEVMALRPVTYTYKDTLESAPKGIQVGLIAEEVREVAPLLVVSGGTWKGHSLPAVDYQKTPMMLINAIQEQQGEILELRTAVNQLRALNGMKPLGKPWYKFW